jgi:hypothetical protein
MSTQSKGTGDVVTDDKTVLIPDIPSETPFISQGEVDRHDPAAGAVLHTEPRHSLTAKEYRDKGYKISDKYADDDLVFQVEADSYGNPHDVILADGSVYESPAVEERLAKTVIVEDADGTKQAHVEPAGPVEPVGESTKPDEAEKKARSDAKVGKEASKGASKHKK